MLVDQLGILDGLSIDHMHRRMQVAMTLNRCHDGRLLLLILRLHFVHIQDSVEGGARTRAIAYIIVAVEECIESQIGCILPCAESIAPQVHFDLGLALCLLLHTVELDWTFAECKCSRQIREAEATAGRGWILVGAFALAASAMIRIVRLNELNGRKFGLEYLPCTVYTAPL